MGRIKTIYRDLGLGAPPLAPPLIVPPKNLISLSLGFVPALFSPSPPSSELSNHRGPSLGVRSLVTSQSFNLNARVRVGLGAL